MSDKRCLRLGPLAFYVSDAWLAGRVVREERRRLLSFGVVQHPLPEIDRLGGVVTGLGHKHETDVVRLALLLPREGQLDADLRPEAERRPGHLPCARTR